MSGILYFSSDRRSSVNPLTATSAYLKVLRKTITRKSENDCSTMASGFSKVMAAKLGTVGEYVYLWNKLLYPVVLDRFCEPVG